MKKILFLITIILIGITRVDALTTTSQFKSIFIWYYHYVDENGKFGDFEIFKRTSDEKIAYCIEPGIPLTEEEYIGYSNLSEEELANKVGLTKEILEEISLLSYYGYGYKNHNETAWIVATQVKIWNLLGRNIQFTSRNSEANPWQYVIETPEEIKNMMKELDNLIQKHKTLPSINNKKLTIPLGKTFELQEESLNDFKIITKNKEVTLKNGNLQIKPTKSNTKTKIELERKHNDWTNNFIVYHHNDGQDLILTGNVKNTKITFSYETIAGSIKLKKLNDDTKTCSVKGTSSLEGAIYGIYNTNNLLVGEITIKNCEGTFFNIPIGNYYIKEKKAPLGFELDETKYPFTITEENINQVKTLTVYEKPKKIEITINKKYLKEKNISLPEEGAVFDIFSKTQKKVITTIKTDSKGNANITLPYDDYLLIQKKGKDNYKFIEPKEFSINEKTNKNTIINLINEPYTKKVKIIKVEKNSKQRIKLPNIEFKIYDTIQKKYICENKNCTFKTNENGEFITNDLYPSTYTLEEVQNKIPNLLWNKDKIKFTIDKNTNDILEIVYENEIPTGEIILHKTDEQLNPLSDIEFELFAKENIYNINNVIIYEKNQKIASLKTDELGYASIKNLPLGLYYLKESKGNINFQKNENVYDIELAYKDELTPVITYELNVINYKIPKTKKNNHLLFYYNLLTLGGILLYDPKKKIRNISSFD